MCFIQNILYYEMKGVLVIFRLQVKLKHFFDQLVKIKDKDSLYNIFNHHVYS